MKKERPKLNFHHIGLVVEDINSTVDNYAEIFGRENVSSIYTLKSQGVNECFVKIGHNSYIGLVSPINERSVAYNLLKKRAGYYHLAYKVKNIAESRVFFESKNYKSLNEFKSEAFQDNLCLLLITPEGHLIELIEE